MSIKTTFNYSPNFSLPKRKKNQIKFIIIHYTGMKSEVKAIQRLTEIQSMVSSHFFVKKNGKNNNNGSGKLYCLACWRVFVGQI